MEKKGLCISCIDIKTCIFNNGFPVWQCEEFSEGNSLTGNNKPEKVKRVMRQVATESE